MVRLGSWKCEVLGTDAVAAVIIVVFGGNILACVVAARVLLAAEKISSG